MKDKIHPKYHEDVKVICGCGHSFSTGSTVKELHVEVCSSCHPLFTGTQKMVDSRGRVDRFKRIREKSIAKATAKLIHKKSKAEK